MINERYHGSSNEWGYFSPIGEDADSIEAPMDNGSRFIHRFEFWAFEKLTAKAVEELSEAEEGSFVSIYFGPVDETDGGDVYKGTRYGKVIKRGGKFSIEWGRSLSTHYLYNTETDEWKDKWIDDPEYPVEEWKSLWERDDKANRDSKYRLMWSKDGLGEDEIFDDLDVLRASFKESCKDRLCKYKLDHNGYANVPVIPESKYEQYAAGSWYDYDSCCWVNREWAADYGGLRPGAYFGDLNGYAKNITDKGRLGRTRVKFT